MGSGRAEVWVRVYRVFRPRRGVLAARAGETVEIGLGPEPDFRPTSMEPPALLPLPTWRPRGSQHPHGATILNRALVWRALLAAGALRNRAALARWQGVSRARVTQVMRLLRGYRLQQLRA